MKYLSNTWDRLSVLIWTRNNNIHHNPWTIQSSKKTIYFYQKNVAGFLKSPLGKNFYRKITLYPGRAVKIICLNTPHKPTKSNQFAMNKYTIFIKKQSKEHSFFLMFVCQQYDTQIILCVPNFPHSSLMSSSISSYISSFASSSALIAFTEQ